MVLKDFSNFVSAHLIGLLITKRNSTWQSLASARQKRKRYRNRYLKKRLERNKTLYVKRQNYCVSY